MDVTRWRKIDSMKEATADYFDLFFP
jgi:hypothetical protein